MKLSQKVRHHFFSETQCTVQLCISLACNVCVIRSCIIAELYSTAVERLRLGNSHWKHYRHYRHFLGCCKYVMIIHYDYDYHYYRRYSYC